MNGASQRNLIGDKKAKYKKITMYENLKIQGLIKCPDCILGVIPHPLWLLYYKESRNSAICGNGFHTAEKWFAERLGEYELPPPNISCPTCNGTKEQSIWIPISKLAEVLTELPKTQTTDPSHEK